MNKKFLLAIPVAAILLTACTSKQATNEMASPTTDTAMMSSEPSMMASSMATSNGMMSSSPMAQDGVMVGGSMMVKTKTIPENAANASNLTTLVAAVKAAGLVDALSAPGPFTVFAPTNDAFNKLPKTAVDNLLKPENKAKLQAVLKHHVVSGSYKAADFKDGMMLTTLNNDKLKVTVSGGNVMVDGATVTTADVIDSNGVSHVIDTVLMPMQ